MAGGAKCMPLLTELAPGICYMTAGIVNFSTIELMGGRWVLVDTGVRGTHAIILKAVAERYGATKPEFILLTHGHFDHAGSVEQLARTWDVPVYAHALEMPFLTGQSSYPPMDPTVGGLIAQMSRFFPRTPYNLGERVKALSPGLHIPLLTGWRLLHT